MLLRRWGQRSPISARMRRPRVVVAMPARPERPGEDVTADLVWDLAVLADQAMREAGADTRALTPADRADSAIATLGHSDGLLLVGGGDVDPRRYGGPPEHPSVSHVDDDRDRFELALIDEALATRLPVLALCRGLQVLNVGLGGSLTPQVTHDVMRHHGVAPDALMLAHPVHVLAGTTLAGVLGEGELVVWSGHHQGIDRLASGLRVAAVAPDGLVEAVEHENAPVLAVQWHPEYGHETGRRPDPLFTELVDRARRYREHAARRPAWL
jgi:putative glutamine amidotransferase